jgi:hypothetical protein
LCISYLIFWNAAFKISTTQQFLSFYPFHTPYLPTQCAYSTLCIFFYGVFGMATTPHLQLTLVEQAQAQKEVTVNQALHRIDALLNAGVLDKDLSTPPSMPAEGDVYIVAASPTGDWATHALEIAYFNQVWRFIAPREGLSLWVCDEDAQYVFDGSAWVNPLITGIVHSVLVRAGDGLLPTVSNGCAVLARVSTSSASADITTLDFDASAVEYAQILVPMPKRWDKGGIRMHVLWSHASAASPAGVVWRMETTSMSDGSSLLNSYGSNVTVPDTGGSADTLYISPTTASLTPAGTISDDGLVAIRISRVATDSADTLAMDARIHAVRIFYGIDGLSD